MISFKADLLAYQDRCYPGRSLAGVFFRSLFAHPAIVAVMWFRFGRWAHLLPVPVIKHLLLLVHWLLFPFVRWGTGIQLLPRTPVGHGLVLLHYGPTIVNPRSKIGSNVTLYHCVTLAADSDMSCPTIEDGVLIGVNCVVFGAVTIGRDSMIGAGAVVTRDIPPRSIAGGVPARVIRSLDPTPPSSV